MGFCDGESSPASIRQSTGHEYSGLLFLLTANGMADLDFDLGKSGDNAGGGTWIGCLGKST